MTLGALVLTALQIHNLNIAYDEGMKYGIPKYTQAIILTESSACIHKVGDDGRSLGCGQLQVATARKVCRCIIGPKELARNDERNIQIGAQYLSQCFLKFWPDRDRAILCYNLGPYKAATLTNSEVAHSKYVARVKAWLKVLKDIPVSHD